MNTTWAAVVLLFLDKVLADYDVTCSIVAADSIGVKNTSAIRHTTNLASSAITEPACQKSCFTPCTSQTVSSVGWSQHQFSEILTAATVSIIFNNRTNTTRTTTIYNEEVLNAANNSAAVHLTPPPGAMLNENSTQITTYKVTDFYANTISTMTITYATQVLFRPDEITWSGTIPTTLNGIPTCTTHQSFQVEALPSPPTPEASPLGIESIGSYLGTDVDPKGWLWSPQFDIQPYNQNLLSSLYPVVAAFAACGPLSGCSCNEASPEEASLGALFLTVTSSSTEDSSPMEISSHSRPANPAQSHTPPPPATTSRPSTTQTPTAAPVLSTSAVDQSDSEAASGSVVLSSPDVTSHKVSSQPIQNTRSEATLGANPGSEIGSLFSNPPIASLASPELSSGSDVQQESTSKIGGNLPGTLLSIVRETFLNSATTDYVQSTKPIPGASPAIMTNAVSTGLSFQTPVGSTTLSSGVPVGSFGVSSSASSATKSPGSVSMVANGGTTSALPAYTSPLFAPPLTLNGQTYSPTLVDGQTGYSIGRSVFVGPENSGVATPIIQPPSSIDRNGETLRVTTYGTDTYYLVEPKKTTAAGTATSIYSGTVIPLPNSISAGSDAGSVPSLSSGMSKSVAETSNQTASGFTSNTGLGSFVASGIGATQTPLVQGSTNTSPKQTERRRWDVVVLTSFFILFA